MCHEKYHVDPELRAIANRLTGLPLATSSVTRERSLNAAQLLLNVCACEGLLDYIGQDRADLATGERLRICAKLRSIRERFAMEAITAMDKMEADDIPF